MIVVATLNAHKLAEIKRLPSAHTLDLHGLLDYENVPEIVEDGVSCEENAMIKAVKYSLWLKREHNLTCPVIAEDSGLFVEALLGWPGVLSARIANAPEQRIELVLNRIEGATTRSAYFGAITALAINGCPIATWRGVVNGLITNSPRGNQGFGYDPIFEDPTSGKTFAEIPADEKNKLSHRTKAWTQALNYVSIKHLC